MQTPTHVGSHVPDRTIRRFSACFVGLAAVVVAACEDSAPPSEPASITLNHTTVVLVAVEESRQFTAEVKDEHGVTLVDYIVNWTSGDRSVATVTRTGLVRAEGAGATRISATAGSVSAAATVTVDLERGALEALYEATDGDDWNENEGWLSRGPLSDWYGIETNADGQVVALYLPFNGLSGPLPPEIGNLAHLREMHFDYNNLSGSLPREIANLTELRELWLPHNNLSGSVPPELADLSLLTELRLGPNNFTGPFPAELTRLARLEGLTLVDNQLTGPIPEEIGEMSSLTRLILTNTGLSGPLPAGVTGLMRVNELLVEHTGVCAPATTEFKQWLKGIRKRRVRFCDNPEEESIAYLTQAVQSAAYPVPLVAGEAALLRVFVVAPAAAGGETPFVRATFYPEDSDPEVIDIEAGASVIGESVNESSLENSANALVPASLIQPGMEMVVEIDPEGTTDPDLGVKQRIPATRRVDVEVGAMPDLELTLVPFLWDEDPDSAILLLTEDMSADDRLLWQINALLPVAAIDLTIHDPVVTNTNNASALLRQTNSIREAEDGSGYYMGMMSGRVTGARGVAYVPGWVSFSIPDSETMSHELGHNMYMYHAPCGGAGRPDPSFPNPSGAIGAWGYDLASDTLVDPGISDLMSYCEPDWISDYHFTNGLRYRLSLEEEAARRAGRGAATKSLLLVGGIDREGVPRLEPAFMIDAVPSLPLAAGDHWIRGATADGAELFSLSFAVPEVADGDGSSSFAFVVPVQSGWRTRLARITLSGPGGWATLGTGERPSVIMRDLRTGQVRAILNDLPPEVRTAADAARMAPEPGLEVLFSRGIPDSSAWKR